MAFPHAVVTALGAALLLSAAPGAYSQSGRFCEGEVGVLPWTCDPLAAVPAEAYRGADELSTLPGNPDPANPVIYKQIAGEPAFDASGKRRDTAAVFAIKGGDYFCMLAESRGEAALFDSPEGSFASASKEYGIPTASWLGESVKALLGEGTRLKYIVYTHAHWDHIGTAGFVANYFAADAPVAISSKRTRRKLKRTSKGDPSTVFGNNRGVPVPEIFEEDHIYVGGLRFELTKIHAHKAGDYMVYLDKNLQGNAGLGINTTVVMVVDLIFPGWVPFYSMALAEDVGDFYAALDELNNLDFDVLVGGHVSRLGTKEDVQVQVDFYADVLAGMKLGFSLISFADVGAGMGVANPASPNLGNGWLVFNEWAERAVDVCEAHVLDVDATGRDWRAELAAVEVTLRSQCNALQNFIRVS